jgi:hypothetical protein
VEGIEGAGRRLYRGGRGGLAVQARGAARAEAVSCCGRTRGQARVWLKVRDGPDGRSPPGGEGEREADWAVGPGERGATQLAGLGHAGEKKKAGWSDLAGGKEGGGREGGPAGPWEKEKR